MPSRSNEKRHRVYPKSNVNFDELYRKISKSYNVHL
jgi:hypothetical protein